jgi:hypothetical protein
MTRENQRTLSNRVVLVVGRADSCDERRTTFGQIDIEQKQNQIYVEYLCGPHLIHTVVYCTSSTLGYKSKYCSTLEYRCRLYLVQTVLECLYHYLGGLPVIR